MLHYIIFINACAQNVLLQHQRKWRMLTQLANCTFNNVQPEVAHSLLTCHFSSSTYDL